MFNFLLAMVNGICYDEYNELRKNIMALDLAPFGSSGAAPISPVNFGAGMSEMMAETNALAGFGGMNAAGNIGGGDLGGLSSGDIAMHSRMAQQAAMSRG